MKSVTRQLAEFIAESRYEDLPENVVHEAKRVFLDCIGCALAGMATDKGRLSASLAKRLGGPAESSIIGSGDRVSCANAAFANGELISALDFDATLSPATHVTPFVSPGAISIAESRQASGKELILAMVLGHEITSRVASGMSGMRGVTKPGPDGRLQVVQPTVHGYSANAFGSVAGAARMLRLDRDQTANALGIAGYNAPMQTGAQWQHSGAGCLVKWASAGWVALEGVTAALLAGMGYTGDTGVLDGEYGFWKFAGSLEWKPDEVVRDMGRRWHILNTRYKFYPCCGLTTTPLDCFTRIMETHGLAPEEIQQVKVWMHPNCQMPIWRNRLIDTEVQAQYSVAYDLAAAASGLPRGSEWQQPAARTSPAIRQFMERVTVAAHPDYQGVKPGAGPPRNRVEVMARGQVYAEEVSSAERTAVEKDHGLLDKALEEKFRRNALPVLGERGVQDAVKSIWALEEADNVGPAMIALTPPGWNLR